MRRLFTAGLIALAMLAASPPVHALDESDAVSFTGDTADEGLAPTAAPIAANSQGDNAPTTLVVDIALAPTALEPIVPLPWCVNLREGASHDTVPLLATKPGRLPSVPPPSERVIRDVLMQRANSVNFWVDLESSVTPSGLAQRRVALAA